MYSWLRDGKTDDSLTYWDLWGEKKATTFPEFLESASMFPVCFFFVVVWGLRVFQGPLRVGSEHSMKNGKESTMIWLACQSTKHVSEFWMILEDFSARRLILFEDWAYSDLRYLFFQWILPKKCAPPFRVRKIQWKNRTPGKLQEAHVLILCNS